jgi:hypothetical protein
LQNIGKKSTKTVALDAGLHRELKMLAVQEDVDLSELLEKAVREFLNKLGGGKRNTGN